MAFVTHTPTSPANWSQFTFSRGDKIPLQPNVLLRIERGAVRSLTWSEEGTTVTLGYWGAGDIIGQPLSRIQPYQIECLTSVEVTYVPALQWCQIIDNILRNVQQAEELLCIVRHERIPNRLLQLLSWLASKFGRSVDQGQLIDLRLTHQEIAEVIGTTRVTVTRMLARFEEEGIIYRPRRHFILLRRV
jgi:CRP-like cAMP-binding protein